MKGIAGNYKLYHIQAAELRTSTENNHSHLAEINNGSGKTIKTFPDTHPNHVHQIKDNVVLPTDGHSHKLNIQASALSKAQFSSYISDVDKTGKEWEITILSAGLANTLTGQFFLSEEVMRASAQFFNDVNVFAHQYGLNKDGTPDFNHRPENMRDPNLLTLNKIGWIDNVRYDNEGTQSRLKATFHCTSSVVRDMLLNTWNMDKSKMPEFSIDADLSGEKIGEVVHIKEFRNANSLDMVTKGAFEGAGFERLAASKQNNLTLEGNEMKKIIEQILANIKAGKMTLKDSVEGKSDDEIRGMIQASILPKEAEADLNKLESLFQKHEDKLSDLLKIEGIDELKTGIEKFIQASKVDEETALQASKDKEAKDKAEKDAAAKKTSDESKSETRIAELEKTVNLQASSTMVDTKLRNESVLGDISKDRIRTMFVGKIAKPEEIDDCIKAEKEYLDRIVASKRISGKPIISVGDSPLEKKEKALELFINPRMDDPAYNKENAADYKITASERFVDLKDAVLTYAGQHKFQGDLVSMRAATTATFPTVFQDVMNKQIRKQYEIAMVGDRLIKLYEEFSAETLDEQHIYDIGSFGLLDDVSEGGTYQSLSNPSDVEATYTLGKKGNVFELTEEMFFTSGNKVTALIRQFPRKMASSAKATRNKFVADLLTGCSGSSPNTKTIYDSNPLYDALHGSNFGTAALDYTSLYAGYVKMANQNVRDGGLPAEITPRYLVVPHELMPTAINVVQGPVYPSQTSNGVPLQNPYSGLGIEPIGLPNWYLCGDITNWYLVGDKNNYPTIQIGYFQNRKTPEIFLQNNPTVGSVFSADKWTYKIKWRFGGAVTDWRTFYAGLV